MIGIGDVIQLYTTNAIPADYKRVIIVGECNEQLLGVFINTNPHGTANEKVELAPYQPLFEQEGRPYLDYASHIDCSQPYEYYKSEFIDSLKENIDNLKGTVLNADLQTIIALIKAAPTVPPKIIKKYKL